MIHATGVAAASRPRPFVWLPRPTMHPENRQLLIDTRAGSEAAARALWNGHAPRLIGYARAVIRGVGAREDAEDLVQSVFCRIMSLQPDEVDAVLDPGAWLAQLTRRAALNWLRGTRRERTRLDRLTDGVRMVRPAPREQHGTAAQPSLGDAIDLLPARLREVVVLKHVAGLTFDQIELATGVNRNTAAARYRVALDCLRAAMSPDTAPPAAASGGATGRSLTRSRMVQHV